MIWAFLVVDLLVIVISGFIVWYRHRNKNESNNNDPIEKIFTSLIIACATFIFVGMFTIVAQNKANDENLKLTEINEPLILKSESPQVTMEKRNMKIKFHVKQGTVAKGMVLFFDGNGKASYIPTNFDNKNNTLSANINGISFMKKKARDKDVYVTQYQTVQLGLILKDSKGNVTSYYYIIRPECDPKVNMQLSIISKNTQYVYNQKCNNVSPQYVISGQVIGTDTTDSDVNNLLYNLNKHKGEFNYEFHLVKPENRKIKASDFKAVNGNGTFQDCTTKKNATVTSDPKVGLAYNIPNENEIKENVQLMDKIIKDY